MRRPQIAVVLSLAIAAAGLSWALFSTAGIKAEFRSEPIPTSIAFALGIAFCSWPWLLSYSAAEYAENDFSAYVFSFVSAMLALLFVSPVASGPAEVIGWNIILCVLAIWVSYVVTPRFIWPMPE